MFCLQAYGTARKIKQKRLQMPPFMNSREERDTLLDDDPDIACLLDSKYVFVDLTDDNLRMKVSLFDA